MVEWTYRKKNIEKIEDFKKGAVGFIYEIEFSNGKKYLGRKALFHNRKLPPLKGYKRKRKVVVESDWKKYIGSPKDVDLKRELKNGTLKVKSRAILKVCETPWEMTYFETKYLFARDCILREEYYNSNILGKFYRPKNV